MDDIAKQLKEALNKGVVSFAYEKKNGEWRNAIGTRNPDTIELVDGTAPSGTGTEKYGAVSYWDIESAGWRSFREDAVIEIKGQYTKDEYKKLMESQGYEL
jgi:hypothetical protein